MVSSNICFLRRSGVRPYQCSSLRCTCPIRTGTPRKGRGQDAEDVAAEGVGVHDVGLMFSEQGGQFPDGQRAPVAFARQEMRVHVQGRQFVEESPLFLIGHDMHFIVFGQKWQQRAQPALDSANFKIVRDSKKNRLAHVHTVLAQDFLRQHRRSEPVVDIDHAHARRAGVEHGQQGGQAGEVGSIARGGRDQQRWAL